MLISLLSPQPLPWENYDYRQPGAYNAVARMKVAFRPDEFNPGLPVAITRLFDYSQGLLFDENADYGWIIEGLLRV